MKVQDTFSPTSPSHIVHHTLPYSLLYSLLTIHSPVAGSAIDKLRVLQPVFLFEYNFFFATFIWLKLLLFLLLRSLL